MDDDDFGHHFGDDEEPDKPKKKPSKYKKESKAAYILNKVLSPLINFLCFLLFWCVSKDWVEKHENQERAYG